MIKPLINIMIFLFQNATLPKEGRFTILPKMVAMATSLEESEKLVRIDNIHTNTFHLMNKVKICP